MVIDEYVKVIFKSYWKHQKGAFFFFLENKISAAVMW